VIRTCIPALALLWACSPSPSVTADQGDSEAVVFYSDGGFVNPNAVIYRDASSELPDVINSNSGGACRTGRTAGTVCAPNGSVIAGARVSASTRTCSGEPKIVETNANIRGYFSLDGLASGWTEVTITTGTFVARFAVEIEPGREVPLSGDSTSTKVCLPAGSARLAVLTGDYDNVGAIIEGLGFEYDTYCGSWDYSRSARYLLANEEALNEYDILFVNCASGIDFRATNEEMVQIRTNIENFVRNGGSLYVSDLAVDWVHILWPDFVRFNISTPRDNEALACCVCIDCPVECNADPPASPARRCNVPNDQLGPCSEPVGAQGYGPVGEFQARVVSPFLRQFVENDTFNVNFDAGGWVEIEDVIEPVEILVTGNERPYMVLFEPYERGGRVAYTSFHNHVQATDSMLEILRALVFRL
jgi:hypothetical protein